MAPLEWKDSFSVGVAAVDHEHQELIELVNKLHDALVSRQTPDAVLAAFGDLLRSISSHFALEERFMREHGYDQLAEHKSDHEGLLDELRDIMDDYRDAGHTGESETVERFTASVETWFTTHFKTHDARLHARLGAHPH